MEGTARGKNKTAKGYGASIFVDRFDISNIPSNDIMALILVLAEFMTSTDTDFPCSRW